MTQQRFFPMTWMFCAIAATGFVLGCGGEGPVPETGQTDSESGHDHPHPHDEEEGGGHSHGVGPHGGTVADWGGGEYHVEFTVDHPKQSATVYVLGDDQKTATPVDLQEILVTINQPEFQVTLTPAPLKGEPPDKASRFTGTHEKLGIVREFSGMISGQIDGTPYSGTFAEEAHDHQHGHAHGEDDALVWKDTPKTHEGLRIILGHHGKHIHAGEELEPAVSITRDGKDVGDIQVFNSLLSSDGNAVLAQEVATVFEPETDDEIAHYAQGGLQIPAGARQVLVRFRIVPNGGEEVVYDLPIQLE
ncbi:MAG: hypothetical protein ACE37I_07800 [Rubinisphaera brasiliensis]|uniref:hypothetical protein n=1 Tax=Rubinisphaera brasiliensis TaxID=119 RepID=UPI00391A093E